MQLNLLSALRKRFWALVVVPILVAVLTLLVCFLLPTQYTATATLFVAIPYQDGGGSLRYDAEAGGFLVSDFIALFDRSPVLQSASEALGVSDITQSIRFAVSSVSGTRVIDIQATGRDAALCADAANRAAYAFSGYLNAQMRIDGASVAKDAVTPQSPSFPKLKEYAVMAYCIALALCFVAVLLLELLSDRIKSDAHLTQQLNLSLLATVPDYRKMLKRFLAAGNERSGRLYRFLPDIVRESAKTAAVNISESDLDEPVRTLAITSVAKGEGKSSLAVLLASAYAEDGKRVLLVDMDMRNPTLGSLLKRQGTYDLTDYLAGRAPLAEVAVRTSYKNLFFIDSHHRAALVSRIVASKRFTTFLDDALEQFDIVLFDTSPLGLFIDPALLAAKLDGAILSIADNKTEMAQVKKALDQLARSKVTLLGAVLNFVKPSKAYAAYYGKEKRRESRGAGRAVKALDDD
ncbi:MAG: polysaccharide biosynthesis tyrosine autokinase [Firmicutes bacterium]|nr:polysaccharide biosynthesis tyrosine autokinase [Bacillota bacterium]